MSTAGSSKKETEQEEQQLVLFASPGAAPAAAAAFPTKRKKTLQKRYKARTGAKKKRTHAQRQRANPRLRPVPETLLELDGVLIAPLARLAACAVVAQNRLGERGLTREDVALLLDAAVPGRSTTTRVRDAAVGFLLRRGWAKWVDEDESVDASARLELPLQAILGATRGEVAKHFQGCTTFFEHAAGQRIARCRVRS